MLSFQVKFVQTDRGTDGQTDRQTLVKQYAPIFQYGGIKSDIDSSQIFIQEIMHNILSGSIKMTLTVENVHVGRVVDGL